mmetsp:Transcript_16346/g.31905  ORF Transcript_16346/g.31905 Transcript_16346/m.31905 type:complete len:266 (-) Transcript_16346:389-1186(-)
MLTTMPQVSSSPTYLKLPPDMSGWEAPHYLVLAVAVLLGFEFYRHALPHLFPNAKQLRARGKHLDKLSSKDYAFMVCNEALTIIMAINYLQYAAGSSRVVWKADQLTIGNTLGALAGMFVVYDFVYTLLHRALHHRLVYAYIHKHHHRQVVPTRGNTDAINVHPIEFALGEYNHLLAFYVVSQMVVPCHAMAGLAFLVLGGALASLNHTRLDLRLRLPGMAIPIFDVRAHDTHHCIPMSNYGQYIMMWDWVMGSYKYYEAADKTA